MNSISNDTFSKFSEKDKNELILYLDSFYLTYRDVLNFNDMDLTFGLEIEAEYISVEKIGSTFDDMKLYDWFSKYDRSLNSGGEITSPIMYDCGDCWKDTKVACNLIKENRGFVTENCGGHIHLGASVFQKSYENWLNFVKCIITFEDILYRFGYGETEKSRHGIDKHAGPISNILRRIIMSENIDFKDMNAETFLSIIKDRTSRRVGINFQNVNINNLSNIYKNTIEFRFPNGTIEEIIWQNNVNVFGKMLLAIKNNKIDIEWLDNYIQNNYVNNNTKEYSNICFDKALMFADMIFDNNLDKLYFLRQYLKNSNKQDYEERRKKFILNK